MARGYMPVVAVPRQGYYCRLYEAQQELESYAGTQQKEVTV